MPIYLNNKKIGGVVVTVESSQYTTQDATISSSNQLMAGVTAYGPSGKITGTMPTTSIPNPNLTVSSSGLITVTLDAVNAGYLNATSAKEATRQLDTIGATTYTPTTTAQVIPSQNYLTGKQTIAGDEDLVAGNIKSGVTIFGVEGTYSGAGVSLQTKTATPTESSQEIRPDSGYDGLSKVTVGAISSTYVGSNVARRSSTDLSASGATVSVPAGYYNETASKSVASGTAGNPVASKGTVTNHAISITPSVTNTTGYITGGTKTGTAVTVSASELVSGTLSVTTNGTKDVTNYASIDVNVAGSGSQINNQDKTVSPSEDEQIITADSGYTGLGTVTVRGVSEEYVGSAISVNPTITVAGKTVTIPKGYYSAQSQKTIMDVDLIAGNIRKDIDIFGIVGTYEGTDHVLGITQDGEGYLVLDDNDQDLSTYVSSTGLLYTKKMTINIGMESSSQYLSTALNRYGSMPELEELTLTGGITNGSAGTALVASTEYFPVSKYPKLKVLRIQPTSVSSGNPYFTAGHYCFNKTNLTTLVLGSLGGPYWAGAGYFRKTDENGSSTTSIGSTDGLTIIVYTNAYRNNAGFGNGSLASTTNIIEYNYLTGEQLVP